MVKAGFGLQLELDNNGENMNSILVTILVGVLKRLVSEQVVVGVLVGLGDYLVPRTSTKLDDEIWSPVRKALKGE